MIINDNNHLEYNVNNFGDCDVCSDVVLVESDRMYVEKVKRKKDIFDGLFICQCILTSIFYQNNSRMRNNYDR